VTERGAHAELMALGGIYAELFSLQAAAYADDSLEPVDGARGAIGGGAPF